MSDDVTLTFAADTTNVRLARTVAAAMAARADLPIDQLEDVRLAVDEAVSQLILDARAGSRITCAFALDGGELDVTVSALTRSGDLPATDTFSWTVLRALCDSVTARSDDLVVTLHLHVVRHIAVDA